MEQLEGALQGAETGQALISRRGPQTQQRQLERESQALANKMAALVAQVHLVASSQPTMEETQKYLQRYSPACSIFTPPCVALPCDHKARFTQRAQQSCTSSTEAVQTSSFGASPFPVRDPN